MSGSGRALIVAAIVSANVAASLRAQCPDGSPSPCAQFRAPPLDTARYVILPFTHREGIQLTVLDGAGCADLLTEAFERWTDVRLADKTRVSDALRRRHTTAPFQIPLDTGLEIARRLGAGKLVMGQLWSFGDTLRLTASVYDVARGGTALREAKARTPARAEPVGPAFNSLADSLLGATPGVAVGAGASQTRSLRAFAAYAAGERAIRAWSLAAATQQFRAAVAADSAFARAYLWLGQTLLWTADSSPQATRDRAAVARHAGELLPDLGATDRALLLAQQAMFQRRWPDACARYREILVADSTNFTAWYGLAECNAGDPVVLRDPRDSARYVFRGSWHTAVEAYRRALLLAPSFNFAFGSRATERLTRLLFAERFWWRRGELDGTPYFGFPGLEADTLAFHPVPGALAAHAHVGPPTHAAALERNRRILVEVASAWADAFPQEPRAHRALAHAFEVSGKIAPTMGEARSALTELASAQRVERLAEERPRDAVDLVRLYVKAGEFDAARRAGDSLLRATARPAPGVAGVAILLGRPALATRLLAVEDTFYLPGSADNEPLTIPLKVAQTGLVLLTYATVAAPRESIATYERAVEGLVAQSPGPSQAAMRSALLDVPAELVFETMGLRAAHRATPPGPRWLMAMQWALAHGDTARVRAGVDTLLRERGPDPPADEQSIESVYLTARLLLALGDTAGAARYMDGTLETLSRAYSALLAYLPMAGTLVRMMALRAELAAERRETRIALRWARAVVALWSGAEPALQPTVERMRRIVQTAR